MSVRKFDDIQVNHIYKHRNCKSYECLEVYKENNLVKFRDVSSGSIFHADYVIVYDSGEIFWLISYEGYEDIFDNLLDDGIFDKDNALLIL